MTTSEIGPQNSHYRTGELKMEITRTMRPTGNLRATCTTCLALAAYTVLSTYPSHNRSGKAIVMTKRRNYCANHAKRYARIWKLQMKE
jgi:hypothetical protein